MSGVIGIPCNDAARYSFFSASLSHIVAPSNTQIRWAFGSDRIRGRNNLVRESLEVGSEWMWFLDDDHCFSPFLLRQLLAHEVSIVTPIYLQRTMPFAPVVYTDREDDEQTYVPLFLPDYSTDHAELVPIRAAGTGGMLIRSEVFRAIGEPWFEHGYASEDLIFCEKAREAGFELYCDLQAHLGHITTTVVWPAREDESWQVGFTLADNLTMTIPIGTREQLEQADATAVVGSKA